MKSNVKDMTRKELQVFSMSESREWDDCSVEFNSFVIIPTEKMHESGYPIMHVVACRFMKPVCNLSLCADSLCLEDLQHGLMVDILPKSGLVHVHRQRGCFRAMPDVSTLTIVYDNEELIH